MRGGDGLRGGTIDALGDHRMAMMGAVAGLASREGVEVVGIDAAAVSYPSFVAGPEEPVSARSDRRPRRGRQVHRRARARPRAGLLLPRQRRPLPRRRAAGAATAAAPSPRELAARDATSSCAPGTLPASRGVLLRRGRDVSADIRTPAVAAAASRVAADPAVRAALLEQATRPARARRLGGRGTRHRHRRRPRCGAEGVPDRRPARAGPQAGARARRGPGRGLAELTAARRARPRPRAHAPLRPAPDAVEIDTSTLTVGEVVARIAELVRGVAGR